MVTQQYNYNILYYVRIHWRSEFYAVLRMEFQLKLWN